MRMFIIFLLLSILPESKVYSQSSIGAENLSNNNTEYFYEPNFMNADSALNAANLLLEKANKSKDVNAEARAYYYIGTAYKYKEQLDSANLFYHKAKELFTKEKKVYDVAGIDIAISKILIRQYKIDAALRYLIEADSISIALKNSSLQADVQWHLGLVYKNNEDYSNAARAFKYAMNVYSKEKDYSKFISTSCNLSMAYRLLNRNDSSLQILEQCIEKLKTEQPKDSFLYAEIEENLGDTYLQMNKHNDAIKHFKNALKLYTTYNRPMDIAYQKYSIGLTLSEMKRFSEAVPFLLEAYEISDSLHNNKYLLWISKTLARVYMNEKDWQSAFKYSQKTADISDSININNQLEKTNALNKKFETEKKEKEIALLKSRNQIIFWTFISGILILLVAGLLIWLHRTRNKINEEKILNYFATSLYNQNTIDDVFWDIAKNCISQLNFEDCVIYEYDETRNVLVQKAAFGPKNPEGYVIAHTIEIPVGKGIVGSVAASLKAEIIKDTRKDTRYIVDDTRRNSEITIPILVEERLLGVIDSEHHKLGFFTKRHLDILQKIADICSKKVTRYFVEEGLRKKIARDLHDDMGSTLSSINIISKVALQQNPADGHLKNQLSSIKDFSSNIMESMSDMVWAINPLNDSMESLIVKMKEWAAEICEPKQIVINFEEKGNTGHVKLDAEKRKHVFLIFKEAINNAAKYSNCKNILINFAHDAGQNNLELIITDDGDGFDVTHHKTGNGLQNMQTRAGILQGQVQVISSSENGTCIQLICQV